MALFLVNCGGGNKKAYRPKDLVKIDQVDEVIASFRTPVHASYYEGKLTLRGRTGIYLDGKNYINSDEKPKEGDCVWLYVKDGKCYLYLCDKNLPWGRLCREARKWCEENIK